MKKLFGLTLVGLTIISVGFTGCKKGENDPFLSVHSRKARMAGDWKMTSGKTTSTNIYSSINTTTITTTTFDGANANESVVTTTPIGSNTSTDSYAYTDAVTYNRDGSFSGTNVNDGTTTTFEGNWNFEGGVGDVKNRSQLILFYTKIVEDGVTTTIEGNNYKIIYDIDELRNKKFVLTNKNKTTYSNGDSYEDLTEMTFEQ